MEVRRSPRRAAFHANRLNQLTVAAESGGNPNAVSPKGAMGLYQVMPDTARDPGFGIRPWTGGAGDLDRVGQQYRAVMQKRYGGDLAKMWGAYNAGPGRVDKAIAKHGDRWLEAMPAETQNYVRGLMRRVGSN